MILGIGTDICDINRIAETLEKFEGRFKGKTFTQHEQEYCDARAVPANAYAKRFAAKEAVAKALAGQNTGAMSWKDVEVINQPSGRPDILLHGDALKRFNERVPQDCEGLIHISLSDDPPFAQAFAIVEARKSE